MLAAAGCASADPGEDQFPAAFTGGAKGSSVHMTLRPTAQKYVKPELGEPVDNCDAWKPLAKGIEPVDAFSGAAPYAIREVVVRAHDMHAFPVAGKDCLSCHNGKGDAPQFDFAGTLYTTTEGTEPVPHAEVRVIRQDGYYVSVHTDEDGNFWHKGTANAPRGSKTGVRNDRNTFVGHLNGAACNSCHTPNNRLYLH